MSDHPHRDRLPRVDRSATEVVGSTKWIRLETLSYLVASSSSPPSSSPSSSSSPNENDGMVGRRRRKWDRAVRTTKRSEESIDAAIILAVIRHPPSPGGDDRDDDDDEVVCVSQYRPAVDAFVLELPAGLIDAGEDPVRAAMRELGEETGFFGTPSSASRGGSGGAPPPGSYLSPGLSNESARLIRLDVDLADDRNARTYDARVRGNIIAGGDDGGGGDAGCGGMTEDERERGMTTVLLPVRNLLGAIHSYLETNTDARVFAGLYHLAVGMDVGRRAVSSSSTATSTSTSTKEETASSLAKEMKAVECDDDEDQQDQQDREDGKDKVEEDAGHDVGGPLSSPVDFPLVELEFEDDDNDRCSRRPTLASSIAVTSALRTSGFLLVRTHLLPQRLQGRALDAARRYLGTGGERRRGVVVAHPTDPKRYAMFEGFDSLRRVDAAAGIDCDGIDDDDDRAREETTIMIDDLEEWYRAARATRTALLRCIAIGLGLAAHRGDDGNAGNHDADILVRLHDEDNDSMRLLEYPPGDACTGNRCREHSDYGTLTLLLTDGVGGLEAYVDDEDGGGDGGAIGGGKGSWKPVPYAEGAIVVNVGSILSDWTGGKLRATLHRVAGPASAGRRGDDDVADRAYRESLLRAVSVPRCSIAYFADPNGDVSIDAELGGGVTATAGSRVSDYIRWRSGGSGSDRSGVAFTSTEESRLATIR